MSHVLQEIGNTLLDVVAGPGSDPLVTGVAIHDPVDATPHQRGSLVLGVGVSSTEQAGELIVALARAGAAGLVLRAPAPVDDAVREAAGAYRVPLLVAAAAPWSQLMLLLRAVVIDGPADDGPGGSRGHHTGDLFALSNSVAAALGGAVTIEDRASRVLAFSANQAVTDAPRVATVLGREVPAEWRDRLTEAGVFDRLYSSSAPIEVVLPDANVLPRVAVAVRAGEELLGSVWATAETPLDDEQRRVLVSAARTAALYLLQQRAAESVSRRHRSELATGMLNGGSRAAAIARRLGLPAAGLTVVAARPAAASATLAADREARLHRTCDVLNLYLSAFSPAVVTTTLDETAYAILHLAVGRSRDSDEVRQTLEMLAARRAAPLVVGVGRQVQHPRSLDVSRADADAVLAVLPCAGRNVAEVRDVWAQVVLAQVAVSGGLLEHFRAGPVAALADYDAEHGTSLLLSLRLYLDEFGDTARAARRLHIHVNSLRYRLRRIVDITEIDLDDPDVRLAIGLQLRLDDTPPEAARTQQ
jgi:sugar diacid utilization regulator